jgi:hypothetical protein
MPTIIFRTLQGPVPPDHVKVTRWASAQEVALWKAEHTHIPLAVARGMQVYVTLADAPKPGGTGPYRIDFFVPQRMLAPASKPEWRQILPGFGNTPIYNTVIMGPL